MMRDLSNIVKKHYSGYEDEAEAAYQRMLAQMKRGAPRAFIDAVATNADKASVEVIRPK